MSIKTVAGVIAAAAVVAFAASARLSKLKDISAASPLPAVAAAEFLPTVPQPTACFLPRARGNGLDSRRRVSMGAAADAPDANVVGMQATSDSRPIHRVYVDGFWMDATEVTNAQFAEPSSQPRAT